MLARLAVFAGGFDLAAIEAICSTEPLDVADVLDIITSLVEKSLLRVEDSDDGARYRMLETIRDYASEKLLLRDELTATAQHHCDHFLAMAKASNLGLQGPEQADWTRRVEADLDNLRAAISRMLEPGGDPVLAVKFAVALLGFWMLRGYAREGRNYVRLALETPGVKASDVAHAHALYVGAALADSQSHHAEAKLMLETCLALRRGLGKDVDIAATLSTLSLARLHAGDAAGALEVEGEAVTIFSALGDHIGEAIGHLHLGEIYAYVAEPGKAREHFEQCLAIARDVGHFEIEGECERELGELSLDAGDVAAARECFTRSLTVCGEAGEKRGEATSLWLLGKADVVDGDVSTARIRLDGALRAFRLFEMHAEILGCLEDYAEIARALGDTERAVRLSAAIESTRAALALARTPGNERRWQGHLAALRAELPEPAFAQAWSKGSSMRLDDAVLEAQSAGADAAVAA